MDINALLMKHGNKTFKADKQDEYGAYMCVDEYKIHIRSDDISLAEGLPIHECRPLIDSLEKL